ncbi:MAG: ABC transporter permease [Armatimonadota bacterium]
MTGRVGRVWLVRAATLMAIVVAWEWFGRVQGGLLFPTFSATLLAFGRALTGPLPDALWVSNQAMLGGFALAAGLGVPLGLLIGRVRRLERGIDVYLNILMVTPMAALIPLFIMALGLGLATRILVVFVFAFPVVVVNTRAGIRKIDPSLIEMACAFGISELRLWWRLLLPGAVPGTFTGLRLGLARALTGMVVVELLLVAVGVGDLILRYQGEFQADYLFAVTLAVVLEAMILMAPLRHIEQRLSLWTTEARE